MEARADIDREMATASVASPAGTESPGSTSSPPRQAVFLIGAACGLSVANVYFAHPLLDAMARAFAIEPGTIGIVVTVAQIGYGLGLIFIVPSGDLMDRRRLI
jgi:predicted MFS family arabinose efflux permease